MTAAKLSRAVARKVLDTIDAGLVAGMGDPEPGKMCVEAAVCYALGLPHGDDPACVSPILRHLKIALNDQAWADPAARAKGLRRLGIAQLGSTGMDGAEFLRRLSKFTIGVIVPRALRSAIKAGADPSLEAFAARCEKEKSYPAADAAHTNAKAVGNAAAKAAAYVAANANAAASYAAAAAAKAAAYVAPDAAYAKAKGHAAAYFAAANAASYAADVAAKAAADAAYAKAKGHAAAYFATAADDAAYVAATAATAAVADAAYAATAAVADAAADAEREVFAEGVVQILVEMKVPGTKWLDLTT